MRSWDTYSRAALGYSRLRPRQVTATLTPAVGERSIALPADALAVSAVTQAGAAYVQVELLEALTDTSGALGWAATDTELIVTPAPATTDPFTVIYAARHLPDAETQTYPTIPAAHLPLVDDLELALTLEAEADVIVQGPLRYVLGQTDINREKAPAELRARAAALRLRVEQVLGEPYAIWQ